MTHRYHRSRSVMQRKPLSHEHFLGVASIASSACLSFRCFCLALWVSLKTSSWKECTVARGNCSAEGGGRAGGMQIKLTWQNLSHGRKNILSVKFQTIASETLLALVFPKCDGKTADGRWTHEYVVYTLHERIACSSPAP